MTSVIRSLLLAAVLALAVAPAADAARPCHGVKRHTAKCAKAASSQLRSGGGGII
jgi:hypothetical protein